MLLVGSFCMTFNVIHEALVHDSVLAEVPEDEIEHYSEKLQEFIQKDRGLSIPGAPVGCDFDVADDYSLGKFEKLYCI